MFLHRSWMFVPGNHQRMLEKSARIKADVLIFDLEDAVPASAKEQARQLVQRRLLVGADSGSSTAKFVRINDLSTQWWREDVETLTVNGLTGLMIPKINDRREIEDLDRVVADLEKQKNLPHKSIRFVPLIETASGLYHAFDIAAASSRITNLAFGSLDFILDIDARPGISEIELSYARSQLVVASRAAGIASPVDAVYPNIRDLKGLKRQSDRARRFGFQGKLCIHPDQIEPIHAAFSPSEEEIQEARDIYIAYEQAISEGRSAIEVKGKMVDPPVAERARKIIEFAGKLSLGEKE